MRNVPARFIAWILVVSLLVMPASLSAKQRRGAQLIVTRLDGSQVSGELIAVKPDSLLLLSEGKDVSIGLADVHTVVIVRRSHAALFAGIGGVAGAAAGATAGAYVFNKWDDDDPRPLRGGLAFGALGALAGLLANSVFSWDPRFTVAGRPEADVARFWDRLRAHSREGALPGLAPASPGEPPPPPVTERPRNRFRLSVSAALPIAIAETPYDELYGDGSFYFPNETAPEAGPYGAWLSRHSSRPIRIGLGPVGLAYEWTPHWSIDAEFFTDGGISCSWSGFFDFNSSTDSMSYQSGVYDGYEIRFVSFLLGLSYHPFVRDSLQRHNIEIGAAAGPAWISGTPYGSDVLGPGNPFTLPSVGEIGFSGRVQAAYEYYFAPSWSLGLFAGYRFMEKRLTGVVASGTPAFWESGDSAQTVVFRRLVEVSLPALSLKGSGPFVGLRVAFRI